MQILDRYVVENGSADEPEEFADEFSRTPGGPRLVHGSAQSRRGVKVRGVYERPGVMADVVVLVGGGGRSGSTVRALPHAHAHQSRGERLRRRVARRPTYVLDRGYQLVMALVLAAVVAVAFAQETIPFALAAVLLAWAGTIYTDAVVRGRSVFDVRVAAMAIFIALGSVALGLVGVLSD
jgi:hypothetical protein